MDLPPLLEMSNDEYDAADESDNSLDMGSAEVKPPISLKQTEYSLKKFGKGMGQAKDSVVNKWKKVWVAGFLHNKHWSMIQEQNHLNQVQDWPQHWETAVVCFFGNIWELPAID